MTASGTMSLTCAHCFLLTVSRHVLVFSCACCILLCDQLYGLQAARRRLDSADVMLKGPEGVMKWRPLHAHLVGRRCRMATMLGQVYAIGPQTGTLLLLYHTTPAIVLLLILYTILLYTAAHQKSSRRLNGTPYKPHSIMIIGCVLAQRRASI